MAEDQFFPRRCEHAAVHISAQKMLLTESYINCKFRSVLYYDLDFEVVGVRPQLQFGIDLQFMLLMLATQKLQDFNMMGKHLVS